MVLDAKWGSMVPLQRNHEKLAARSFQEEKMCEEGSRCFGQFVDIFWCSSRIWGFQVSFPYPKLERVQQFYDFGASSCYFD